MPHGLMDMSIPPFFGPALRSISFYLHFRFMKKDLKAAGRFHGFTASDHTK